MLPYVDHVLAVLPFEPEVMRASAARRRPMSAIA
jgi:lipid A disaccharide synthetase